ncbi:MAG TPA: 4Fe-4S dicluster domain-containing protein [Candidatus Binataceae bacterium]|nr:4Fe-4S dicluster domain-containing protein [Candidatus Binataceae bacterium]
MGGVVWSAGFKQRGRQVFMSTLITEECINCGACVPVCPNNAIYRGGEKWGLAGEEHPPLSEDVYYIAPDKCSECVGFFEREQCAAACPVDCCIPDPGLPEREAALLERAQKLHPDHRFGDRFPSRFRKG